MLWKVAPDIQSFDLAGHGKPGISAILLGSSARSGVNKEETGHGAGGLGGHGDRKTRFGRWLRQEKGYLRDVMLD